MVKHMTEGIRSRNGSIPLNEIGMSDQDVDSMAEISSIEKQLITYGTALKAMVRGKFMKGVRLQAEVNKL